jgi:hypothetical protein
MFCNHSHFVCGGRDSKGGELHNFKFANEGITNEIVDGRRISSYFVPIAKPKKKGSKQLQFDTEWTQDRIEENKLVNDIRRRITLWRQGGYVGVTPTTARLIAYWTDSNREKKLWLTHAQQARVSLRAVLGGESVAASGALDHRRLSRRHGDGEGSSQAARLRHHDSGQSFGMPLHRLV